MAEAVAHDRAAAAPSETFAERAFVPVVATCTAAVAVFLALRLTAWPPHEDETLALFVGRDSLDGMLGTVLNQRGGAPLHFLFAWAVAHLGGGLEALRAVSAFFAVTSLPLLAVLAARLAGKGPAIVATILGSASWMLLFHGVYGRMYSVFLFTSLLSFLALEAATETGGRGRWAAWIAATLLCVAAHPYGALVLAAQGVYLAATRLRVREAAWSFAVVLVLGIPFWRTDLVLAGRFEVGVGGGGGRLGSPLDVLRYLAETAGDFVAGYRLAIAGVIALAAFGAYRLARTRRRSAILVGAVVVTPAALLMLARFGSAAAPESRHLIFVLPFFLVAVATGLVGAARSLGRVETPALVVSIATLVGLQLAWGWSQTRELYRGESSARVAPAALQPTGWRKRRAPTTCCSATTRCSWRPGETAETSRARWCPAPIPAWRCARCNGRSRSAAGSGSSTRATPATPSGGSKCPTARRSPGPPSRHARSGRFSSCARSSRPAMSART